MIICPAHFHLIFEAIAFPSDDDNSTDEDDSNDNYNDDDEDDSNDDDSNDGDDDSGSKLFSEVRHLRRFFLSFHHRPVKTTTLRCCKVFCCSMIFCFTIQSIFAAQCSFFC